ncbi:MAG TPA: metallophosphoesterase [Silvibacterium sp.]|nr:metallophosphoesterase [Silvibacterium sp.]
MESSVLERRKIFTRRSFLKAAGLAAVGIPLYAAEISRHEISVERHSIHLARLPDQFRGLRIVQISDFHYAEYTEPFFMRDIVERVNRLNPDVVLLSGDFVTVGFFSEKRTNGFAYSCAEILSHINCPVRYAVLGNHDSTFAQPAVADALAIHHLELLYNSFVPLERDGKRLWFAGTGSATYQKMEIDPSIPPASRTGNEPVILMIHEPDVLPLVARHNVDLMISGHTHGGQVRFPFMRPIHLPPLGTDYVEGLYRHGPTQLYVNRGIGTVELPFRFNCPPEITEITLA